MGKAIGKCKAQFGYLRKVGDWTDLYTAGEKMILVYPREDTIIKVTYKNDTTTIKYQRG